MCHYNDKRLLILTHQRLGSRLLFPSLLGIRALQKGHRINLRGPEKKINIVLLHKFNSLFPDFSMMFESKVNERKNSLEVFCIKTTGLVQNTGMKFARLKHILMKNF